jgi:predicted HD superfamily hydrolase involved in NAD metabolism
MSSDGVFDLARAREALARAMSPEEVEHCERTSATATELARRFGGDVEKATYAGLVHDIARAMSDDDLLVAARRYSIPVTNVDRMRPYLLHAEVGAHLVTEILGVDDPEVTAAVASHTFGRVGMSDLEKIVYLADTVEPARDYAGIERLREAAERDLNEAMVASYERTICHLAERGRPLHPRTVDVWNWLCRRTDA